MKRLMDRWVYIYNPKITYICNYDPEILNARIYVSFILHTHTRTVGGTHARTHAHTHTRTHAHTNLLVYTCMHTFTCTTRERERDDVVYWKTKRKINDDLQCN